MRNPCEIILRPAAFLDRDGVINYDGPEGINRPEDMRLIPGVSAAIRMFAERGFLVVVVTNQAAIAKGKLTPAGFGEVMARMAELLAEDNAAVDAVYHCPHHPGKGVVGGVPEWIGVCSCRKPAPGMILRAAEELGIDLPRSFLAGDKPRDTEAGQAAGVGSLKLIPPNTPWALANAAREWIAAGC